jgi:hypothetical protein
MKRDTAIVLVLTIAVAAVFSVVVHDRLAGKPNTDADTSAPETVTFSGRTLDVPQAWYVYEPGTRGEILDIVKRSGDKLPPSITLEDERNHPEIPGKFVSGWRNAQRFSGFQPQSLDDFHDSTVDAAGMPCVAINWGGARRPLQLVCLSSNGHWKLTLSGSDADIPALDTMARQLPGFQREQ